MDHRDDLTWITLELSPFGEEKIQEGTLTKTLRDDLGGGEAFPICVPATTYTKGGSKKVIILLEGYAFVGSGLDDVQYFKLEKKPYVSRVLSSQGGSYKMRTPMTIPNLRIKELRRQLQEQASTGVATGDTVHVTHGVYRNLDGLVQGIQGDTAFVEIRLRSLEMIVSIPRAYLEVKSKESGGELTARPSHR